MLRKGQKSLEMIVGLIILLVVAAVVISMFLNIFTEPDIGQDAMEEQEIIQECDSLCQSWQGSQGETAMSNAIEYCTKNFVHDATGDGSTTSVAGSGYNSYCEDGTYCFNKHTCESGRTTLDAERCRELMCEYYVTVDLPLDHGEGIEDLEHGIELVERAENRIEEIFLSEEKGIGSCDLVGLEDNAGYSVDTWYSNSGYDFAPGNTCEEEFESLANRTHDFN